MVDAAGTTKYTYYAGGLLNAEDGPWTSDTVTYTYNNARLRSCYELSCHRTFARICFRKTPEKEA